MNKKLLTLIIILSLSICVGKAQDSLEIVKSFRQIVKYIREDSIYELAGMINYPLIRPNPIPNITDSKEFITYAPVMFDSIFKQRLSGYADSDIFEHNGYYGLVGGQFHGEIWINEDGFVESINCHTAAELQLQSKMTRNIQNQINPAVNKWKENVLVCETQRFLIRIDYLDNNQLRYVSWSKPKTIKEKPDLVLFKGVQDFHGTMGGVSYTFRSKTTYYQIDQVEMGESEGDVGLFLRIFKNAKDLADEKTLISYKCIEIK
jgi:hypothetical protein